MATAYMSFCRVLSVDTATTALIGVRQLVSEAENGKPKWDTIRINIACGGGDLVAGFALFNELKEFPVKIITHNVATVDSAAILFFMVGTERVACAQAGFHFHQPAWTFASKDQLSSTTVADARRWLETYQKMMCDIVSADTNMSADDVRGMMDKGATLTAKEALKVGLVHNISEPNFPQDARWHQI
jgi:ATP-dependent Clp protease, protease subunit